MTKESLATRYNNIKQKYDATISAERRFLASLAKLNLSPGRRYWYQFINKVVLNENV